MYLDSVRKWQSKNSFHDIAVAFVLYTYSSITTV